MGTGRSTADIITRALYVGLDRVFTADLPRDLRVSIQGEPRVSVIPRFDRPGRAYVTINFEVVQG